MRRGLYSINKVPAAVTRDVLYTVGLRQWALIPTYTTEQNTLETDVKAWTRG